MQCARALVRRTTIYAPRGAAFSARARDCLSLLVSYLYRPLARDKTRAPASCGSTTRKTDAADADGPPWGNTVVNLPPVLLQMVPQPGASSFDERQRLLLQDPREHLVGLHGPVHLDARV